MTTQPNPPVAPPLRPPKGKGRAGGAATRGWVLCAVVLIHGLLLGFLATSRPLAAPSVAPPILVSLIAPPQPAPVAAPASQPPVPAAKPQPQRTTKAVPTPLRPPRLPAPPETLPSPPGDLPAAPGAATPAPPTATATPSAAPEPASSPRFDAAYLNNKTPYPPLARRLKESGTVRLRVLVSPEGQAEKIELLSSSGSPRLDEGALQAVERWRFIPARQGDRPVASTVIVPIVYKLEDS